MTDTTAVPSDGLSPEDLDLIFSDEAGSLSSGSAPVEPRTEPRIAIAVAPNDVAALYLDGTLSFGGDHYAVYLRALEAAGIELIETDDFLLGRDADAETIGFAAAPTLAVYRQYAETTRRTAALRNQAQSLLDKAAALEADLEQQIGVTVHHEGTSNPIDPATED